MKPLRKPRKSERDKIAADAKVLTKLLLWEASGGIIPLPKGAEGYVVPQIAFPERRALLDSISRSMLTDLKVDPDEEVSGFDLLKSGYGNKRNSGENSHGGVPSAGTPAIGEDESAEESAAGADHLQ